MSEPLSTSPDALAPAVASRTEKVEVLYLEHRDRVYRLALRYGGGSHAWAEDITQEVFLRLFDVVDGLQDDGSPATLEPWFYRVTTNRCLNRLRAERLRDSAPVRWLLGRRADDGQSRDPERVTAAREGLALADAVLASLPPKERVAFSMHVLDGKKQIEIAELLGHSKGYVSKLIARAEERIRSAGWEVPSV